MSYSRRVIIASVVSVVLHGTFFWMGHRAAEAIPKPVYEELSPPLVFKLQDDPEVNQRAKRLISTPNPTTEEVEDTDLISNANSKAQDESDVKGDRPAPHVDEPEEFDRVEQAPSEQQQPIPEMVEASETTEPPTETAAVTEPTALTEEQAETAELPPPVETPVEEENPEQPEEVPETDEPEERIADKQKEPEKKMEDQIPIERYEVAQAQPQPPQQAMPLEQELSASRGRKGGGADQKGVMNFEAKSHEMGEYMLEVRRRVERQWHMAIQLRYLGVKRAEATIECVIRPSGIIEEVRIVDPGPSMPFAVLCRDAIQDAGPFPKLSFEVPEIYRSQNIEIRWKFSYL